jgi:hypothetical protein
MERATSIERQLHQALGEQSAAEILAAIGDCPDLTLVRCPGDPDEELAGIRSLLSDRRFREIELEELASSTGRIALVLVRGGSSPANSDWAPRALALAEKRFERVIVLPSNFDVSVDEKPEPSSAPTHPRFDTDSERREWNGVVEFLDAHEPPEAASRADFRSMCRALPYLSSIADFYGGHGLVMSDLFEILPTLKYPDSDYNVAAARTVLTLLDAIGEDRFLEMWSGGQLDQLLEDRADELEDEIAALRAELDETRAASERVWTQLSIMRSTRVWRLATMYWRLRDRLRAAARRS